MKIIIQSKEAGSLTWELPKDVAVRFAQATRTHKQLGTESEKLNEMERIIVDDLQGKLLAFLLILQIGLSSQKPNVIMIMINAWITKLGVETARLLKQQIKKQ